MGRGHSKGSSMTKIGYTMGHAQINASSFNLAREWGVRSVVGNAVGNRLGSG